MKVYSRNWLWLVMLTFATGCNTKLDDNAMITIKSATQHNADVRVTRSNYLNQTTVIESTTDSTGFVTFEVAFIQPMFVGIQIGNKYGEVYLSPGDNLVINENGEDFKIPLTFSGKGAVINNYISTVNTTVEKIKWAQGRGLAEQSVDEFLHRFDSLKTTIQNFHEHYIDSVSVPSELVSMLERKNLIKFLEVGQEYKFYQYNNAVNEKWDAYKLGHNHMEGKVSKELENLTSEIPFDTTLLTEGYGDYQILLNFYWHNKINLPVAEELIGPKDLRSQAPLMSDALIKKGDYPEGIREFFIAFNLKNWFGAFGITTETDSVFASFKNAYPKSNYLNALNAIYKEWLAVAPGKPVPELVGYSVDGKKVSVKDFKGKIVYMDVWATWCAPCVAEIPASKKLQEQLKNNDNIQFLNVSVDSRRSDWEKFLTNDKNWKGLHIIVDRHLIQSFYKTYKLFGVPAYILIDSSGNIVTMKASRPSEGKIKAEIEQLLAKGVPAD